MRNRLHLLLIVILIVFATLLRVNRLSSGLFFGFEQGRDAQVATDIIAGSKFTLIGPKTDISGIFHGAGYYYLIAPLYAIGQGNPIVVVYVLALLNSLSVIFIYLSLLRITRNVGSAVLGGTLFATSYNAVVYARWLSNVSPSIFFTSLLIFVCIEFFFAKKNRWWISLFVVAGLLFHFEVLNGIYALVLIVVCCIIFQTRISLGRLLQAAIGLFPGLAPFLLFEVRHSFLMTHSVIRHVTTDSGSGVNASLYAKIYAYVLGLGLELQRTINIHIPPSVLILILAAGIVSLIVQKKRKAVKTVLLLLICSVWSWPQIPFIQGAPLEQFYAGTAVSLIILTCTLVFFVFSHRPLFAAVIIGIVSLVNAHIALTMSHTDSTVFYRRVHKQMTYSDQVTAIEYLFKQQKAFHYDAFVIPYYSKNAWDYLYSWVGSHTYPALYNKNAQTAEKEVYYLLIEPSTSGPYLDKWISEYDEVTRLTEVKQFGAIQLQVRKKI